MVQEDVPQTEVILQAGVLREAAPQIAYQRRADNFSRIVVENGDISLYHY
jgi:hypothetical protein